MSTPELKGPPGELHFMVQVRDKDGNLKHQATMVGHATPDEARALGAEFVNPQTTQEPSNGSNPLDRSA